MATEIVYGVEKIELGTPGPLGELATDWAAIENIEDNTVSYTANSDTKTNIIPEDKDSPLVVLHVPGNPDSFNFNLLELSEANFVRLFNNEYDQTTSTVTVLAKRAQTPLAIRLTTREQFGVKKIFTFQNCLATVTLKNNFTKNALVAIAVVADILSFKSVAGNDAIYTVKTVTTAGATLDSTPPTVSAGPDQPTVTTTSATFAGTATANSPKTIVSTLWTKKSGPAGSAITAPGSLTSTVTGLVIGTYVFTLTATDSNGDTASDDVTITKTA